MGNNQVTLETTVYKCERKDSGDMKIYCEPGLYDCKAYNYVIIKKSSPNYTNAINELKIGYTYRFVIRTSLGDDELISIHKRIIHKVTSKVSGILCLELEGIDGYCEVILPDWETDRRLLIPANWKTQISPGQYYTFEYRKFFGGKFYEVTNITRELGG